MKFTRRTDRYTHPWCEVVQAFWRRYPNQYARHVLSEDVLSRSLLNKGNVISTKRLLTKTNRLPKWAERFTTNDKQTAIIEESFLDRIDQTFTTYTRNIGYYTGVMTIEEKCVYSTDPDTQTQTLIKREAWVTSGVRGFRRVIERFGSERYNQNAVNAHKGLIQVLCKLFPARENQLVEKTSYLHKQGLGAKLSKKASSVINTV